MAPLFSDVENTSFAQVLYVNSSPLATHAENMYRSHASCETPLQRCDRNPLKNILLNFLILNIFRLGEIPLKKSNCSANHKSLLLESEDSLDSGNQIREPPRLITEFFTHQTLLEFSLTPHSRSDHSLSNQISSICDAIFATATSFQLRIEICQP